MLVGLPYRVMMQVCLCALLSFVQNHSVRAGKTGLVEGKTIINSSKSDFMGTEAERQTFSKFQSNQQNCNEP